MVERLTYFVALKEKVKETRDGIHHLGVEYLPMMSFILLLWLNCVNRWA